MGRSAVDLCLSCPLRRSGVTQGDKVLPIHDITLVQLDFCVNQIFCVVNKKEMGERYKEKWKCRGIEYTQ